MDLWLRKENTVVLYQKLWNFDIQWNNVRYYTKIYVSKTKIMELCATIENYGTMAKTMVLWHKLSNFDLLWINLWYYIKSMKVFKQL